MTTLFENCLNVVGFFATGSSIICDPPVVDSDKDYVIYTNSPAKLEAELVALGYTKTSDPSYGKKSNENNLAGAIPATNPRWPNPFNRPPQLAPTEETTPVKRDPFEEFNTFDAYRHPDNTDNLIVLSSIKDFRLWKVATLLAKDLNVTDKAKRIALFRAVRSGGEVFQPSSSLETNDAG